MPGVMEGYNRWLSLNTGTSIAYGSYGTVDSAFNVTSGPWNRTAERTPDTDEYTGYEEDTSSGTGRVLAVSVQGDIAGRATPHILAILGAAALGSWSSATAGTLGTAATAYKHRIFPIKGTVGTQGAGTLPALMVCESLSGATDFEFDYRSCMVNTFSISASKKNWVQYTASLVGDGNFRASTVAKSAVVSEAYLKAGDVTLFLGTALAATMTQSKATADVTGTAYGSAINVTGKVIDFKWDINNNLPLDEGYAMNSGTTRGNNDRGVRTQALTITMELHSSAQLALLESQKTMAAELECFNELIESNAYYGFNLGWPKLSMLTCVPSGGPREKMKVAMTFHVGEDTTKGSVLLDIYNTRSAYLQ